MDTSRLIQGDAFELIKSVADNSIRLILTDPPYNISRKNNFHTMKVKRTSLDFGEWDHGFDQVGWLPDAVRCLMPGGSIVIWNSFENLGLLTETLTSLGMSVKRQLVCIRTNPMPRNRDRLFTSSIQNAIWAVKPGAKKPHGYLIGALHLDMKLASFIIQPSAVSIQLRSRLVFSKN